ncbi:MAG: hypothetical protein PWP47_221, partial [Synergistaceae bacterium]|nr:hypothetical protein [Synergistaceae bacterium]
MTRYCAAAAFFLIPSAAEASSAESPSLTGYMIRIGLSLAILALAGYGAVRYSRRAAPLKAKGAVSMLASLPLGKDVLFIVRLGPDVVALASGGAGTRVIGRWRYEDWKQYED